MQLHEERGRLDYQASPFFVYNLAIRVPLRNSEVRARLQYPIALSLDGGSDIDVDDLEMNRSGRNVHLHDVAFLMTQQRLGNRRSDG